MIEGFNIISQLTTINNRKLHCIIKFRPHPINKIQYFQLGSISIFEVIRNEIANYSQNDMISIDCLNKEILWNESFFEKLRNYLSYQNSNVKYQILADEQEENEGLLNFQIQERVEQSGVRVFQKLFSVKVKQQLGAFSFLQVLQECQQIIQEQAQIKQIMQQKIELQKQDMINTLLQIDENYKQKNLKVSELINKVSLLIQEKNQKYLILENELQDKQKFQS